MRAHCGDREVQPRGDVVGRHAERQREQHFVLTDGQVCEWREALLLRVSVAGRFASSRAKRAEAMYPEHLHKLGVEAVLDR